MRPLHTFQSWYHTDYQGDALITQSPGQEELPDLTNKTADGQSWITWVWGQSDTHQMTTHLTCCCSDWRRRLPGMPTSPGTWCLWNWCTDHQGRTWAESGERMSECSGGLSPLPETLLTPRPHITLSSQSQTPWWLDFLPLNNFWQPGMETGKQKEKENLVDKQFKESPKISVLCVSLCPWSRALRSFTDAN